MRALKLLEAVDCDDHARPVLFGEDAEPVSVVVAGVGHPIQHMSNDLRGLLLVELSDVRGVERGERAGGIEGCCKVARLERRFGSRLERSPLVARVFELPLLGEDAVVLVEDGDDRVHAFRGEYVVPYVEGSENEQQRRYQCGNRNNHEFASQGGNGIGGHGAIPRPPRSARGRTRARGSR